MNKSKVDLGLRIAIGVLLAALSWTILKAIQEPLVATGDTAPDFSITTDRGTQVSTHNFGGRLLVLNFWATWCAPCVEEVPSLNQLQRMMAGSGVVVLGISVDRNEERYKAFLQKFNITFQTARDPNEDISYRYGTFKVPETYIIGAGGKVLDKIIGPPSRGWTDPEMVARIRAALATP
jgi:cytochrome c biogenesis protein CcmG, thiol:disulfide interchange protein DsbE